MQRWHEQAAREYRPRVWYVRDESGRPVATVAAVQGGAESGVVHVAVAFVSRRDQFCRRIGRAIAVGRCLRLAATGRATNARTVTDAEWAAFRERIRDLHDRYATGDEAGYAMIDELRAFLRGAR